MTAGGDMLDLGHIIWHKTATITSGLALGIDTSAHQSALQTEKGKTVGVMATGIERIYPSRNAQLAKQIIDKGGALVTEFLPALHPDPLTFRNEIEL